MKARAAARAERPPATTLDEQALGMEARIEEDHHQALKLWLRLLATSTQVEIAIRNRLRERFGISLARFDYLAQLYRHPEGISMGALSNHLMVTGGSVTGLTNELVKEGLVAREVAKADRRSYLLRLTAAGRKTFEAMAAEHEAWVVSLFAGLPAAEREQLAQLLGHLRLLAAQAGEA